jgi:prevent-host-death family protein
VKRKDSNAIQTIAISEFKAKCLSLLKAVDKTKAPLRVTKRGKVIAEVVPASPETQHPDWLGSMSKSMEITGDVVSPVIPLRSPRLCV